jgi:putative endopeptidase
MRLVLITAALLASTAVAQTGPTPSSTAVSAGVDRTAIDQAVKPGDDFDAHANGAWRQRTEIPADRSGVSLSLQTQLLAERRNAEIVAAAARAAPGTDERRIADYHRAFLDTARIEALGTAPLQPDFRLIENVRDKAGLSRVLGAFTQVDVDPLNATDFRTENLFGLFVSQHFSKPAETVPYVLQGGLGLPDRDYYVSQTPQMAELRRAYQAYIAKVMGLAGLDDPAGRAARVMALETKIATAHATLEQSQDAHKANNPWTRADFQAKAPGIDWAAYWTAAGLPNQREFIVWHPEPVAKLAALVATEPLADWRDWLRFHRVNEVAAVLPRTFDEGYFDFYGRTLQGTTAPRPRDKRAISAVNGALGDAVGRIYAERYFPASSKADIQGMVKNILASFDKRVAGLDWMQPATKAEARRKIATMQVGVGYPERWRSYEGLVVRPDTPVANLRNAQRQETRHQLAKIGRPVDRAEWWMTPQTVNAVNLPLQNALNFPAAILEAPFYDPKRDAAANYGSIGAVVGHEITHGFDNLGADFDSSGRLRNWWTPADLQRFGAQGEALVAQYDAYEALPGLKVNGKLTLGENIADVAGLAAAHDAYRASLGGRPAPVIDGMTGDQRFFLAYAQTWAGKAREKALRGQVATDVHAPGRFRAQTVRNLDDWYAAFGVKPGDALYLPPEKRVQVW